MSVTEATSSRSASMLNALRLDKPGSLVERRGRVVRAFGTSIRVTGVNATIGQRCVITRPGSEDKLYADVVGLVAGEAVLYPLGPLYGVASDSIVQVLDDERSIGFSDSMQGRVFDGLGRDVETGGIPAATERLPLDADSPNPLKREPVTEVFATGVKAIDSLLTVGVGQRLGIFAMAGGGKSTLLAMLAKHADADVIVIGLIGERGREVREFLDESLGEQGRKRSIIVVATSDRPAMERVMAAQSATAIAERMRASGKRVLLLMDSVTRYARALREIGLSIGEPPVRQGFPPSVFAELPRLFERAGNDDRGSITAFYTVLVDDDDGNDPVAEETRSILDGHIVLSRKLGQAGHYPAIDVLGSASRLFHALADEPHQHAASQCRQWLAKYQDIEFLVQMGEYEAGADAIADKAIARKPMLDDFLRQSPNDFIALSEVSDQLLSLTAEGA